MREIRAVITDLDGTVLDEERRASPATLDAAAQLVAGGIALILATDRTPSWVGTLKSLLDSVNVAVCCGGAVAWRPATGELLWREVIRPDCVEEIARFVAQHLPEAGVSVYDGERSLVTRAFATHGPQRPGPREVVNLRELVAYPACALSVCSSASSHGDVPRALRSGLKLPDAIRHWPGNGVFDIGPPGVDKGHGVRRVLAALGVDPAQAIAFGDMPNDLPVFSICGHCVAVANAHRDVIAAATWVAECVHHDGFARTLARLALIDARRVSQVRPSHRCFCTGARRPRSGGLADAEPTPTAAVIRQAQAT